ncbi:MAG: hypothetical protein AAFX06_26840 [Planctomycetota bacterium]
METEFKTYDEPTHLTVSCHASRPCPVESLETDESGNEFDCPFAFECDSVAVGLPLAAAYGKKIAVTLTEPVGNIVTRSEQQFSADKSHRIALRKHIYELEAAPFQRVRISDGLINSFGARVLSKVRRDRDRDPNGPLASLDEKLIERIQAVMQGMCNGGQHVFEGSSIDELSGSFFRSIDSIVTDLDQRQRLESEFRKCVSAPLMCHSIQKDFKLGRYLGFVDVRTNSIYSPLALAILVPPRHLRHDTTVTLVQGNLGKIFGAHSFVSCAYSMHDPESGGAYCAQAAMIMGLAMLSDRGATVRGSFDLTHIGATHEEVQGTPLLDGESGNDRLTKYPIYGLSVDQIITALGKCNVQPQAERFPISRTKLRLIQRLLVAYCESRFPSLLFVDSNVWNSHASTNQTPSPGIGHVVTVIGIKRGNESIPTHGGSAIHSVSHLIINDPGAAPFLQRTYDHCLRSAYYYNHNNEANPDLKEKAPLIFIASNSVKRHAADCIDTTEKRDYSNWEKYIGVGNERLSTDFSVSLVHRSDISRRFCAFREDFTTTVLAKDSLDRDERFWLNRVRTFVEESPDVWYWVVAGYDVKERTDNPGEREGHLSVLWLFSSVGEHGSEYEERILLSENTEP